MATPLLKYTVIRNWRAEGIVTPNTQQLLNEAGSYYDPMVTSDSPNYSPIAPGTNTMPRSALIRVSLDPAAATTSYGFEDDPDWAGQEGYYSICSNDLTIGSTGQVMNYEGFQPAPNYKEPADFGVDNETGYLDATEAEGYSKDYWTTDTGSSNSSCALWQTEYDPITGVDGFRMHQLCSQNPNYANADGSPTLGDLEGAGEYKQLGGTTIGWSITQTSWSANTMRGSRFMKKILMFDTVGRTGNLFNNNTKGLQGNEVLIFILFKDWFTVDTSGYSDPDHPNYLTATIPSSNNGDIWFGGVDSTWQQIKLEIMGRPKFTHTINGAGQGAGTLGGTAGLGSQHRTRIPVVTNAEFKISYNLDDDVDVAITTVGSWSSKEQRKLHSDIVKGNTDDSFLISGRYITGRSVKFGKIELTAPDGKYFTEKPYLKTKKNNLRLRLKQKKRVPDSSTNPLLRGQINYYCFEVFFKSESKISKESNINTKLIYNAIEMPIKATGIHRVEFGSKTIGSEGETRKITVYGLPHTDFSIAVNEALEEQISLTEGSASEKLEYLEPANEQTVLRLPTHIVTNDNGSNMMVLQAKTNSSGRYSFTQTFPSTIITRAKIASGATASTFDFNNISRVRDRDRMTTAGLRIGDRVLVEDKTNDTRAVLDTSLTLTTNQPVVFRRKRVYIIRLLKELANGEAITFADSINDLNIIRQYDSSQLTLTHGITTNFITSNNGLSTSLGAGGDFSLKFIGEPNSHKSISNSNNIGGNVSGLVYNKVNRKTVSLLITLADAADRITAVKTPIFDSKDQSKSDWTNSVSRENGGTVVRMWGFTHSAVNTSNTITLTYYFDIINMGFEDVEMTLNLDNILTIQDN